MSGPGLSEIFCLCSSSVIQVLVFQGRLKAARLESWWRPRYFTSGGSFSRSSRPSGSFVLLPRNVQFTQSLVPPYPRRPVSSHHHHVGSSLTAAVTHLLCLHLQNALHCIVGCLISHHMFVTSSCFSLRCTTDQSRDRIDVCLVRFCSSAPCEHKSDQFGPVWTSSQPHL